MEKLAKKSPALSHQSEHYPERFKGKVPYKVKMLETVTSDLPAFIQPILWAYENEVYEVWVNTHGAVSAFLTEDMLGLKPNEFEVVEWHEALKGGEKNE